MKKLLLIREIEVDMIVNMHESKTSLSRLVKCALEGDEVIIAVNGEPKVKLMPVQGIIKKRVPGTAKGRGHVPDSFFEPLPDEVIQGFNT